MVNHDLVVSSLRLQKKGNAWLSQVVRLTMLPSVRIAPTG